MANIYDVARVADVSVATVSAVVNATAYVSPRLKTRVEAAIKSLGYQPNHLARGLAMQQSRTLGMIVPDIANPFFPEVVRGAEDAAYAAGYTLLIASSDNDTQKEAVYLRLFLAKRVDGVILTKAPGRLAPDLQRAFEAAGVPIVLLARTVAGLTTDLVQMDDKGAAFEAVTHLHRLGYRRIGFIGDCPARAPAAAGSTATARRCARRSSASIRRSPWMAIFASSPAIAPASSC